MIFVDTSGFYAYLSHDDQDHGRVREALTTSLASDQLAATSYVIAETMGLIQRRLGLRVLSRFVDDVLPSVQIRWIGPTEHALALALLRRVKKRSFTIVDASSAAIMQRDSAHRIVALDPEFERLGLDVLP